MTRHVVTATVAGTSTTPPVVKGQVIELTAAQETALSASLRATTRRDATGEPVGVSN
jgi:hypothetical protein